MPTFRDLVPATALALALTVALVAIRLAPRPGEAVLVLFPPGFAVAEEVVRVAAAGLRPIASPRSFIVLAAPGEDPAQRPDGALMTIDALGARGCSP